MYTPSRQRGQSLVELILGIAIAILFITGAIGIIVLSLRISSQGKSSQTATELTHELANQIPTLNDAGWNSLAALSRGTSTLYHLDPASGFVAVATGTEALTVNGAPLTRGFTIEDVYRDSNGAIVTSGGTLDPATLKITVNTSYTQSGDTGTISFVQYLARNKSRIFNQTGWEGGSGQEGPITATNLNYATATNINHASIPGAIYINSFATTEATTTNNIDTVDKWAWNDVIGWVDFNVTGNVTVGSTTITGYASSGVGYVALDCATSPSPSCSPSSYGITNDGNGILSGYAWNDAIGWISFKSTGTSSVYGVTITSSTGDFNGWAWNDVVGWFSFNCADLATCGTVNYKTKTLWSNTISTATLTGSVFDTQITGGAGMNTIMWQGTKPTGTNVKFQLAGSNSSSGPWTYVGPDGTSATYYQPAGPDVQVKINKASLNNLRYVRYRVTLESNIEKTYSPLVSDIIIGWSP